MLSDPEGFEAGADGNISIIRGSHLWRDPEGCRAGSGPEGDREMAEGWLRGKTHPLTGEAMVTEQLVLPPGSLVTCNTHAAHMVSPKGEDRGQRLAASHFYKGRSSADGHVQPAGDCPPLWAIKAAKGELSDAMTDLFRNGFDRELTGGRWTGIQH